MIDHEKSNHVRATFLEAARSARNVLDDGRIAELWDGPSALAEFSLRGLAGHLVRGVTSVEDYLNNPLPSEAPITAAEYYVAAVDTQDIFSPLHAGVRQRGEDMARVGHSQLLQNLGAAIDRLTHRLPEEPVDRVMRVFRDLVTTLDGYLETRIVELVVHMDDLAISIGKIDIELPEVPLSSAIATLIDVGRHRHGDLAVLRALSRRERDEIQALRIF